MTSTAANINKEFLENSPELLSASESIQKVFEVLMGMKFKEQKVNKDDYQVSAKKMYAEGTGSEDAKENALAAWVVFRDFLIADRGAFWELRVQARLNAPSEIQVIFNIADGIGFHVYEFNEQSEGWAQGLEDWLQSFFVVPA